MSHQYGLETPLQAHFPYLGEGDKYLLWEKNMETWSVVCHIQDVAVAILVPWQPCTLGTLDSCTLGSSALF